MREIKFRGKRIDNGEWICGDLTQSYPNDYPPEIKVTWWERKEGFYSTNPVILETVGQYTGLKDKNGVKIYEGDISESLAGAFVVEWIDDITRFCICWCVNKKLYDKIPLTKELAEMAEVIGNIHDNPELLEVQS
jgi:uncharacterized phage protein (TIGR01671 family)